MAPVEKKAVKTWKYGKCSQVFQQKQSFSGLMCTNCGTKKFYCNDCIKSFSHSDTLDAKGSRDNINVKNVRKNSNMSGICFVMPAFMKKNKNQDALTVEKAIFYRTTFILMLVTAPNNLPNR